jgi:endonuclease/exonuclease/phosphatase family metal-dependent hydrolase
MKRVIKILLIFLSIIVGLLVGFVLALQIFEYKPENITVLEINDNYLDEDSFYVDSSENLTILTFNIGYASLSETEDFVMDGGEKGRMDSRDEVEDNIADISSVLNNNPADIYLLQEVDVDSNRSYNTDQYFHFQNLLGKSSVLAYNYRCIFVPFPLSFTQMMGKVNSGVVTFSDYYSDSAERIQLPGSFSWPVRLANLERCVLITKYPIKNSDEYLVVINVHLSAYDDGTMRIQEMKALQGLMKAEYEAGNYVIVGGDFNQTFPEAVTINSDDTYDYFYELKDQDLWEAYPMEESWFNENNFIFAVDKTNPTCRLLKRPYDNENLDNNQYYLIDGFIISDNLSIIAVETLNENFTHSDHNPVKLILSFN